MVKIDDIIAYLKSNKSFVTKVRELMGDLSLLKTKDKTNLVGAINELNNGFVPLSRNLVFNTRFGSTSLRKLGFNSIPMNLLAKTLAFGVKDGVLKEDIFKNIVDVSNLPLHSMIECSFALSSSRIFTTIARMYPNKLNLDDYDDYEFSSSSFIITRLSPRSNEFPLYEAMSFGVKIFDDETEVKLTQMMLKTLIITYP